MKLFFSTLPRNIIECFKGRMLIWHLTAIVLTLALVVSGLDWQYFLCTRSQILRSWLFPAVPIGGLVPIALPLPLLVLGSITGSALTRLTAWAVTQAEVIGGIVAAAYKAVSSAESVGERQFQIAGNTLFLARNRLKMHADRW